MPSATVAELTMLRPGLTDVIRARIAPATFCQRVRSAFFKGAILAVPVLAVVNHGAPRSLGGLRVSWTEVNRRKSSGNHQDCAVHLLVSILSAITPRRS